MAKVPGQYGGVCRRPFDGAGRKWRSGDEISPEIANGWKIPNRIGLEGGGYVYWYLAPDGPLRQDGRELPGMITVVMLDGTELPALLERNGEEVRAIVSAPAQPGEDVPRRTRARK